MARSWRRRLAMLPLGTKTREVHIVKSATLPLAIAMLGLVACTHDDTGETDKNGPYDGPMNILLVIWDTARADHLSAYGYDRDTTPRLASIAETSTVFEQATPGSYWTTASVSSLFSGMASHNHGVDYDLDAEGYVLGDDITTMAEALGDRGYHTAFYSNQSLVTANESLSQGFDEWGFTISTEIASSVTALMDNSDSMPWFAVAYWMGGHAPYNPPDTYDLWSEDGIDDINVNGCDGIDTSQYPEGWACFNEVNSGAVEWTDDEWEYIRAKYDGQILQHDAWIGEIWDALELRGMADDTLFAFTSDHGEALNDHGDIRAWHVWPYDDTQLVPLVVRLPGVFPATVHGEQVRTGDLYATMMDLTGGPADHDMDSQALTEVVDGQSDDRVSVGGTAVGDGRQWYRHDGWKIIYSRENESGNIHELFDLEADPYEKNNLWDEQPDTVETLKAAHAAYLKETTIPR